MHSTNGHIERVKRMQHKESSLSVCRKQCCCHTWRQCQLRRLPCCHLDCQAGLAQGQQPAELRNGSRESAGKASSAAACPPVAPTNLRNSAPLQQ